MKPESKLGRPSQNTNQSFGQHEAAASCYDFTKLTEALNSTHNFINHEAVDGCSGSIAVQSKSTASCSSCAFDFCKVSEALSTVEDEAREAFELRQIRFRRKPIALKEVLEFLKVNKAHLSHSKDKRDARKVFRLVLRSLNKCI